MGMSATERCKLSKALPSRAESLATISDTNRNLPRVICRKNRSRSLSGMMLPQATAFEV
jgi:hypothetical protein